MDLILKYEWTTKHPWAFEKSLQHERESEEKKEKKYSIKIWRWDFCPQNSENKKEFLEIKVLIAEMKNSIEVLKI